MLLTDKQQDALTELLNIAFARTAASLSQLSGHRVRLDVPDIHMYAIDELPGAVANFIQEEIATVQQIFTGRVAGDALLLLNSQGAITLTDLLCWPPRPSSRMDESSREALTEIGNILLNACLGMFGNLLKVQVTFS